MLMPSPTSNDEWSVVHVMRRSRDTKTADFFACAGDQPCDIDQKLPDPNRQHAALLTSRERDVLRLLAEGSGAALISVQLHISITTVRNHIQRMMAKLNVHSRHEAVAYVLHPV
jgi:DNA-binding NarL/FixJ family response regulator